MQPAFQVVALLAVSAYSYEQAEAQLASWAQPVVAAGAQYALCSQLGSQVGAPLKMGAQVVCEGVHVAVCTQRDFVAGAPLAMCAQSFQVDAPLAMGAQPHQAGAQYVVSARQVAQVGAPFAVCALPATPVGAQPEMFAAEWDKDDANALLKLASRARFSEWAGNKI